MRIGAAVGQPDVNGQVHVLVGRCTDPALVLENIALARLKDHIDGVLADDRRELSGRGVDQIAHGEIRKSDPSIDRRADLRVAEIDLRLLERRLRLQHIDRKSTRLNSSHRTTSYAVLSSPK